MTDGLLSVEIGSSVLHKNLSGGEEFDQAGQVLRARLMECRLQGRALMREDRRIDLIGLAKAAHSLRETPSVQRFDPRKGAACAMKIDFERHVIGPGRLEYHEGDVAVSASPDQLGLTQ